MLLCACGNSECRQIMWEWSQLGPEYSHMVEYSYIPAKSKKTTPLGLHKNGYHDVCLRHLLGGSNSTTKETKEWHGEKTYSFPVAKHHWKPCLRDAVERSKATKSYLDKYRCSTQEGRGAGLTDRDKCTISGTLTDQVYYLAPNNVDFADIRHELKEAKKLLQIKQAAVASSIPAPKKKTASSTASSAAPPANPSAPREPEGGRRSPTEREWEQKCRDIANTPQKYALQIQELTKQLEATCLELEEVKKSSREEIDARQKVIDGLRAEYQDKVSTTGLTRKALLSSKWHKKNSHMANYLVGFEKWSEFKAFIKRAFILWDVDVNIDHSEVNETTPITDFEKICICVMMARRAFRRPTLGAIYDRTPSAITGYTKQWVPQLGLVSHFLSELRMEKIHYVLTEEQAKEYKTLYIYSGGRVVDFSKN